MTEYKPVAILTGAASGLGRDLAIRLSYCYRLYLIDRDQDKLTELAATLEDSQVFVCDLADNHAIEALIADIRQHEPDIALLINNAGITHRSLARITQPAVIEKVMAVNFFAPVRLTQGLLPLLVQHQTKVVNISSMAGWMPVMGRAGYCASKSALHQYFETFRAEMRQDGVTVLMVYPSFLDTPIEQNALNGDGGRTSHKRSMVGKLQTSQWMAEQVFAAIAQNKERLFPDRFTHFSSLLYRLLPRVFLHLMRRRFASELEVQP
ncbi:SDR family NAD(P)-dependent oxidoreductase [Photobacterium salinisoli]|uniref:SDR family NAD(P)-dependent oxidoreductase n=1 Tax=Photobacterium salinisoli TaxID=1616783 RepID=UPI000EA3AFA8|nr:SDR family NAD(P)-dependent oxidoreductase [Photobacterium salinisoli]